MMAHADEGLHRHREPGLEVRLDHGHVDHVIDGEQQLGLLEPVRASAGVGRLDSPPQGRLRRAGRDIRSSLGGLFQSEGDDRAP